MFSKFKFSHHISNLVTKSFSILQDNNNKKSFFSNNPILKQKKNENYQIYNIFNHKVPLETSKIKNTFGITAINLFTAASSLYLQVTRSKTPLILKTYIGTQIAINCYKHYFRGKIMLSPYYQKFEKIEQKIMKSPIIKFFMRDNLKKSIFDCILFYYLGKTMNVISPSLFRKLIFLGVAGSTLTYNLNKYSSNYYKNKYNIKNFEIFPNHFNIFPNLLVSQSLFSLFEYFTKANNPEKFSIINFNKKNFLSAIAYFGIGKVFRFLSFFTTDAINIISTENLFSTFLLMFTDKKKIKYIFPWTLMHYLNPYSFWIFLKAKNSLYQDELDSIFSNKKFYQKFLVYFKYSTYNSLCYMINI